MVDTSSLKDLISAFRTETKSASINPERLGSLLQKIADALATAASIADLEPSSELATRLDKVGQVLTALSVGSEDSKKILLSYSTANVQNGTEASFPDGIAVPSANSNKAGAMTAAHVRKLNDLSNNLTTLSQSLSSLSQSLDDEVSSRTNNSKTLLQQLVNEQNARKAEDSNFDTRLVNEITARKSGDAQLSIKIDNEATTRKTEDNKLSKQITEEQNERANADNTLSNRLKALENLITGANSAIDSLQKSINSIKTDANALERNVDDAEQAIENIQENQRSLEQKQTTTENELANYRKDDYTHIETVAEAGTIRVPGAQALIARGLVPIIFRNVISQSRTSPDKEGKRLYMNKKHGWHVHYGKAKIQFDGNNTMQIRDDRINSTTAGQYFTNAATLFQFPKMDIVGYGKRTYNLQRGHRFKFAIAFAKNPNFTKSFEFSCLRTNFAVFHVYAKIKTRDPGKYIFNYST